MADARLRRIVVVGLACAVAAVVLGVLIERGRLGANDRAAFALVERDVRGRFDAITAALRSTSRSVARADLIDSATSPTSVRELMDLAAAALDTHPNDVVAVTVFGADHRPIAWSGPSSTLAAERVSGSEALFLTPGPLGYRLVHLLPVTSATDMRRVGTVGTEWALPASAGGPAATDTILFESLVPVSLRTRYEGAGESRNANAFIIAAPGGEPLLEATVASSDLTAARRSWRRGVVNIVLAIAAVTLVLMAGPVLWRRRWARTKTTYLWQTATVMGLLVGARAILWFALEGPWSQPPLLDPPPTSGLVRLFLRSGIDLFLTALFCLGATSILADALERWRLAGDRRLAWQWRAGLVLPFVLIQFLAGMVVAQLITTYSRFLVDALVGTPIDIVHFSLSPWNGHRIAFATGLVNLHASVLWVAVLLLRVAVTPWRLAWRQSRTHILVATCWLAGILAVLVITTSQVVPATPIVAGAGAAAVLALAIGRGRARYRHASQGLRLIVGGLAVILPALVMYPAVLNVATRSTEQLVERQFGPEALLQREQIQDRVRRSRDQIDRLQGLEDLAEAAGSPSSRAAYTIWANTDLGIFLLTSSVELYGPDGSVTSRFAFNLPEDTAGVSAEWTQEGCNWQTYEEVSPFGSEERRLLFAGRGLCRSDGRSAGAIVIRAMLDYDALGFISARSLPYELLLSNQSRQQEGFSGRDVEFVIYGWSQRPIYTSTGSAWTLDDETFARLTRSRDPFWVTAASGDRQYQVYLLSDRAGIYAVGYPRVTPLGHIINLAEAAVLAAIVYVLILAGATLFSMATGFGPASGRALLREIRASFYRKLFLAFVLASVIPVVTLAFVTRTFIAAQARSTLEAAAVRTAATAQRVIEDYSTLSQRDATALPNLDDLDALMVGISRTIDQDLNIFEGPALRATSERFLFESRLLPERTPSDVYRAIVLDRRSTFVDQESLGGFPYMLAAARVRLGTRNAILTIPLTLRQQQTQQEVDALDRRILLAAVLFILLGAAIGYSMAERIADPVNRLTRATRRITRGDLEARVLETSSDELRTLIGAFNRMASELRHQRAELERTNRIAAWAEMARQVAHEIKNPLTPIQLSAEHLMRIHQDRGKPLTPVLEECLTAILSQVRLLRQISSEFSAFASSPTPHPALTSLGDLIHEVVGPYRTGLSERIHIIENVSPDLPPLSLDRTLLARALTNVIENALHAMPGRGSLALTAARADGRVRLSISDTGEGMDTDALRRVFEPYFSTKTRGTGLGLPIAKRNVELNGGTIAVDSQKGVGTTVTIELPISQS
ncbi:MAG TPA: HAMP domain-containing sensor histidine kinase [Vicinamibacterales bacterium]|jgi:signal transduction histidine kinase